ncbi:MAG: polymer-forming cytoskeletal protein [Alphaproteobacteria bacterium]|nr:polymer-forming cytoskeletal protein [Alphaproteobacteria bacterium]MBF0392315.1 polymer-forming cytoskeletal protein [Alphaproteobacteria bacterium]
MEPNLDPIDIAPSQSHSAMAGPRMPSKPLTPPPARTEIPRRTLDVPTPARRPGTDGADGKRLLVGRDISLSGAITACDKLVVEGRVEANLTDAGSIEIADGGLFKGNAEVDEAEIGGAFEGGLVVRKKLVIRSTGKVQGTVRYGRIVIEAGGEVTGTIEVLQPEPAALALPTSFRLPEPGQE